MYWITVLTAIIDKTEIKQQTNDIQNLLESTEKLNTVMHAALSGLLKYKSGKLRKTGSIERGYDIEDR